MNLSELKKFLLSYSTVLWFLGILIFLGLSIRELIPLSNAYYNDNVATEMQVIPQNRTIKPPSLTVCIPHSTTLSYIALVLYQNSNLSIGNHLIDSLAKEFVDLRKDFDSSSTSISKPREQQYWELGAFLFKRLLQSDTTGDFQILDSTNAAWNQPLIDAVWDFFQIHGGLYQKSLKTEFYDLFEPDLILAQKSKVTVLYDWIIKFLCQYVNYKDASYGACLSLLNETPSYTFGDTFCFALPPLDKGNVLTVRSWGKSGANSIAMEDMSNPFRIMAGNAMISWPFGNVASSESLAVSRAGTSQLSAETCVMKYLIQSTVRGKDGEPCYQESTVPECVSNCMVDQAVQRCRCVPFPFRRVSAARAHGGLAFCTSNTTTSGCLNLTAAYDQCRNDRCVNPCEYVSYQWYITWENSLSREGRIFNLFVSPVDSPFVQFNVTEKQTREQFFANVAGVISLYLGVSGLTLVSLLIQAVDCLKRRKKQEQTTAMALHKMVGNGDLVKLNDRLDGFENRMKSLEDSMAALHDSVATLQQKLSFGK